MIICNDTFRREQTNLGDTSISSTYQMRFDPSGSPNTCSFYRHIKKPENDKFLNTYNKLGLVNPGIIKKRPFGSFSTYRPPRYRLRHNLPNTFSGTLGSHYNKGNCNEIGRDFGLFTPSNPEFCSRNVNRDMVSTLQDSIRTETRKDPYAVGMLSHTYLYKQLMNCFCEIYRSNLKACFLIPEFLYRITSLTTFSSHFAICSRDSCNSILKIEYEDKEAEVVLNLRPYIDSSLTQKQSVSELAHLESMYDNTDANWKFYEPLEDGLVYSESFLDDTFDNSCFQDWVNWDNSQDSWQDEQQVETIPYKNLWENLELFPVPRNFMSDIGVVGYKRPRKLKKLYILTRKKEEQYVDETRLQKVHFEEAFPFDGVCIFTACQTYKSLDEPSCIQPHWPKAKSTFKSCLKYSNKSIKFHPLKVLSSVVVYNEIDTSASVSFTDSIPYDVIPSSLVDITTAMERFNSQELKSMLQNIRKMMYVWWKDRSKLGLQVSNSTALFSRFENVQIYCQQREINSPSILKLEKDLQSTLIQVRLALRSLKGYKSKISHFNKENVVEKNLLHFSTIFKRADELNLHFDDLTRRLDARITKVKELDFVKQFKENIETLIFLKLNRIEKRLVKAYQDMDRIVQILNVAIEEFELSVIQLQKKLLTLKSNSQ